MYKWALFFCIFRFNKKWDDVLELTRQCQDQAITDFVVEKAIVHKKWPVVKKLVDRCCDPSTLSEVLLNAICLNDIDLVKSLINRVDLAPSGRADKFLNKAIWSGKAIWKRVVPCLIAAGLSTFLRFSERPWAYGRFVGCPMEKACCERELTLMTLCHRSGVCSNHRLFTLNANSTVIFADRTRGTDRFAYKLEDLEEVTAGDREAREYLGWAASTPLSLQDLSRQAVSHYLGCHPGREERVQALPVPETVKEFLHFSDLMP